MALKASKNEPAGVPQVVAGGVIAYIENNGRTEILLLRRATGNLRWDWPKGIVENCEQGFDRIWLAAKREFREETSVDLDAIHGTPYSPYCYEYLLSNGSRKKVFLFPVRLTHMPSVTVSDEHLGYSWIESNECLGVGLPVEQVSMIKEFISDRKLERASSTRGLEYKRALEIEIEETTRSILRAGQAWYWYGSWLADEQLTFPELVSDIDLVCFSRRKVPIEEVLENRRLINIALSKSLIRSVSASVHYVTGSTSSLERSPQWSYFEATRRLVAGDSRVQQRLGVSHQDLVSLDRTNEFARSCWYRLQLLALGTERHAAYAFAKGVALLPLTLGVTETRTVFRGYRSYFDELLSTKDTPVEPAVLPQTTLLHAIDAKLGRRSIGDLSFWIQVYCESMKKLLQSEWDEDPESTMRRNYCRCCLALIAGDVLEARNKLLSLESSNGGLSGSIRKLEKFSDPKELRLALLCCLGALRVVLWRNHMQFAVNTVDSAIRTWTEEFVKIGSKSGSELGRACSQEVTAT